MNFENYLEAENIPVVEGHNYNNHKDTPIGGNSNISSDQSPYFPNMKGADPIKPDIIKPSDFVPVSQLGKGSFGEVYLVKKLDKSHFAMKVLSKQKLVGNNYVKYALTERNVLSHSHHPFIVQLNYAF